MTDGHFETAFRGLDRLFGEGTVAGMTDAELLGQFVDRRDEVAISALITRHGPMVLGVCRGVLKDQHDAEDVFQATFLVLIRKAHSLRVERSLSSWLYRVSFRIAVQTRLAARRREARERQGAEIRVNQVVEQTESNHCALIIEEVDRLPERYRVPIVLCGVEGMTHEAAALHLGCPIGTVSGRLFRARELLRARLTRRGVTIPASLLVAGLAPKLAYSAVPHALMVATVEVARNWRTTGAISLSIVRLANGAIRSMLMTKIKLTGTTLLVLGISTLGIGVIAQQEGKESKTPPEPEATKPADMPKAEAIVRPPRELLREAFRIVTENVDAPNIFALIAIAKAQARVGERAAAVATLDYATEVGDKLKPRDRAIALGAIAYAHWESGNRKAIPLILQRAGDSANRVENEHEKLGILLSVGTAQSWTGDTGAARGLVRRMREIVDHSMEPSQFFNRLQVVELQAMVGDYDDALRVVDSVSDAEKSELLGRIADVVGSANHYFLQPPRELTPTEKETRLQVIRRILNAYPKPSIYVAIALADLGEPDEALRIVQGLHDEEIRKRRGDPTAMPWILTRIGSAQAKTGHMDAAKKTFQKAFDLIQGRSELKSRLGQVASAQATSGDFEGALQTAMTIEPGQRTRELISISELQASAGAQSPSKETLRRALEDARFCLAHPPQGKPGSLGANPEFWKSSALLEITRIQARLGDFDAALIAAREVAANRRAPALRELALEQTRAGKVEEVWAWALKLDLPADRSWALAGLAEGLAIEETTAKPAPVRK
ncbi:sigma-70 family RNA polymerase sigma factor [Singulisphaera sp. Ch08]|uniref:Sigma-70 family RNA polymerase sigma factor n=1 Tax=Singulisphaera sp. Ch08 TaxID=3120278 RepID=A0AAU7C9C4_9BACT